MNYTIETIWIQKPNRSIEQFQPHRDPIIAEYGGDTTTVYIGDLADAYNEAQAIGGHAYACLCDDNDELSRADIGQGGELLNHQLPVIMVEYEDVL